MRLHLLLYSHNEQVMGENMRFRQRVSILKLEWQKVAKFMIKQETLTQAEIGIKNEEKVYLRHRSG